MTAFDPTSIAPDWEGQKSALLRAYQQGLINLNAQKGNVFAQQGLLNTNDYTTAGGDQQSFANLQVDPNQQYGGYRNELKSEADMLDQADNGPDRGFSGGLANQAKRTAQQAVGARQTAYQQNLQQTLGNLNQQAGNLGNNYAENYNQIGTNAAEYGANQALWQATNQTAAPESYVVPGASGGGSTPLTPQAIATAGSFGYQTVSNPTNLKPVTFKSTPAKPKTIAGSHGLLGF